MARSGRLPLSIALPLLPTGFEYRLDLANHVTPRLLRDQPIHRWYYFPHSFSPQLVELLLDEWDVRPGDLVLDPFVGAGTTLCVAASRHVDAIGTDLSPLAVFVSNVKSRVHDVSRIRDDLRAVESAFRNSMTAEMDVQRPTRLQRAFTDAEFATICRLRAAIANHASVSQDLLLLALLRVQQSLSRAVPDGGWFRWREHSSAEDTIWPAFQNGVDSMCLDLQTVSRTRLAHAESFELDARCFDSLKSRHPKIDEGCRAIITSPPYPNRHDYSRVFQIELLTLGMDESEVTALRRRSLRSHVEARPPTTQPVGFEAPLELVAALGQMPPGIDPRVPAMLRGYFEDMYSVLKNLRDSLIPGGFLALVVGNVRHAGVMVLADEILADMGERLNFQVHAVWVARLRGNSAQQMGRFGRVPARESILILRRPL